MFTVKHIDDQWQTHISESREVWQTDFIVHWNDLSGTKHTAETGNVYVMNDAGHTISKFALRNSEPLGSPTAAPEARVDPRKLRES